AARKAILDGMVAKDPGPAEQPHVSHYVLKCRNCDFEHHVPKDFTDADMAFAVRAASAKISCIYGTFTVSLEVGDFFRVESVPASGRVLHAGITATMKSLHAHMLSHCDPLFLLIRQSARSTAHEYKRQMQVDAGVPYVRYSRDREMDFVGRERVN